MVGGAAWWVAPLSAASGVRVSSVMVACLGGEDQQIGVRRRPAGRGRRVATQVAGADAGWRHGAAPAVAPGPGCRARVHDGDVSDLAQTDGVRGAGQRGQVGYAV